MTSSEINLIEDEIKYSIRQSASNASTQTPATSHPLTTTPNTNESLSTSTKKSKKQSLINYFLDTLAEDNKDDIKLKRTSSKLNKILNDEIKLYKTLAAQFVATSSNNYNPVKFWKENKSLLPNLALLAQKHLATPSTSIKFESAFSISAYYGT